MKNTHQFWLIAFGLVLGASQTAQACSDDSYTGTVCTVSFDWCPRGTLEANGQLLSINRYNALYALIGMAYGGDGRTTFALPDLRGRSVVGTGRADWGAYIDVAEKRGSESVKLTLAQLPAHTHAAIFNQTGSDPITVNIPVSTGTGTKNAPDSSTNYLSGSSNGNVGANMWTTQSGQKTPVNIGGVTTSGGSSGTVTNAYTGGNAPVATIPPQLGMKQCIVVDGLYPPRP